MIVGESEQQPSLPLAKSQASLPSTAPVSNENASAAVSAAAAVAAAASAVDAAAPAWGSGTGSGSGSGGGHADARNGEGGDGNSGEGSGVGGGEVSGVGSAEGPEAASGEGSGDGSGAATIIGSHENGSGSGGGSAVDVEVRQETVPVLRPDLRSASNEQASDVRAVCSPIVIQEAKMQSLVNVAGYPVGGLASTRVLHRGRSLSDNEKLENGQIAVVTNDGQQVAPAAVRNTYDLEQFEVSMQANPRSGVHGFEDGDSVRLQHGLALPAPQSSILSAHHLPPHSHAAYFTMYDTQHPLHPQIHPYYYQTHVPQRSGADCATAAQDEPPIRPGMVGAGEKSREESAKHAVKRRKRSPAVGFDVDNEKNRVKPAVAMTCVEGCELTRKLPLSTGHVSIKNTAERDPAKCRAGAGALRSTAKGDEAGNQYLSADGLNGCINAGVSNQKRLRANQEMETTGGRHRSTERPAKVRCLRGDDGQRRSGDGSNSCPCDAPCGSGKATVDAASGSPVGTGTARNGGTRAPLQISEHCSEVDSRDEPADRVSKYLDLGARSTASPSISSGDEADVESGDSAWTESFTRQAHKKRSAIAANCHQIPPAAHEFDSDLSIVRKIVSLWNAKNGDHALEPAFADVHRRCEEGRVTT